MIGYWGSSLLDLPHSCRSVHNSKSFGCARPSPDSPDVYRSFLQDVCAVFSYPHSEGFRLLAGIPLFFTGFQQWERVWPTLAAVGFQSRPVLIGVDPTIGSWMYTCPCWQVVLVPWRTKESLRKCADVSVGLSMSRGIAVFSRHGTACDENTEWDRHPVFIECNDWPIIKRYDMYIYILYIYILYIYILYIYIYIYCIYIYT